MTAARGRVLHVVGDSEFGGAAALITRFAVAAREDGWDVEVLATNPVFAAHLAEHGVRVVALDAVRRAVRPRDVVGFARLTRFLAAGCYTVVHTHTSKAGFLGRAAARAAGVPIVVHTAHGFAVHEASSRLAVAVYALLERAAARWCDVVVFVSDFHRRWAQQLRFAPDDRLVTIANGVDGDGLAPATGRADTRRALGVADDDVLLLHFGRLAAGKGIETLLEAMATVTARVPAARLVVAGDGPLAAEHRALAARLGVADRVAFLGFRDDVADLLGAADVVVLPSRREGMSIALLEAMAAGCCVVASDIGPMREGVGEAGVLVPPLDAPALAGAVIELALDGAERQRLGRAARARQRANHDEATMLRSYLDLYSDLAARRPGVAPLAPATAGTSPGAVRAVTAADAPALGALHDAAFPGFFLSSLGARFLGTFYSVLLSEPWAFGVAAFDGDRCVGFAVGGRPSDGFYRRLALRHPWALVRPALPALARRPSRALALGRSLRGAGNGYALAPGDAVLLSICTDPTARRRSLGRALLGAFEERARAMGAGAVVLTTDALDNTAANAFYRAAGYTLDGHGDGDGGDGRRPMHRYRRPLAPAAPSLSRGGR